jgi:hypothetical protein
MVANLINVHYYERYVNMEIGRPPILATRKSQPGGSPTYRFSADGRRQAGDADATIDEMLDYERSHRRNRRPKGLGYGAGVVYIALSASLSAA